MLTRCPACQTVFRLRAEQLRARHGEVRCGHCFNPFNALDHLIAEAAGTATPEPTTSPPSFTPPPVEQDEPSDVTAPVASSSSPEAISPIRHDEDGSDDRQGAADETPAPRAGPDTGMLSDLDFDIPDDIVGRTGHPAGSANTRPAAGAERREPSLDEIDFSTFLEPDLHTLRSEAEAEFRHQPPGAGMISFPALEPLSGKSSAESRVTQEPEDTPASETAPWMADAPAIRNSAPFPDVIRAERRSHEASAREDAPPPAAPSDADPPPAELTDTAATFELRVADNEVETDLEAELGSARTAEPDIDTEYLDATYGKPEQPSALKRTLRGLAVGLLAGTLTMQATYLFRQDIARTLPGLRPLLISACDRLGCDMPLPRDAALIAIETSDLQSEPGRAGSFILHATVRNRADFLQEWPHLELTLTDGADTPLARRVFTPSEWVAPSRLDAGFAARGDAVVRQAFNVTDLAPTGYRVYVFYP
ncbi:MAG: hypothetical protein CVU28_02010 [Betaproteobacteria bacterium HGW-Betaproteobacteria-21]|nr:MAG: hypothetical protein CVU28_02010 [Betaproteobacteria bacterium HGW-Betaproteobacteria-21]